MRQQRLPRTLFHPSHHFSIPSTPIHFTNFTTPARVHLTGVGGEFWVVAFDGTSEAAEARDLSPCERHGGAREAAGVHLGERRGVPPKCHLFLEVGSLRCRCVVFV
jgi:hypothetical protein